MAVARIVVDPERCYGCRVCEMVCSLRQVGFLSPIHSAITRLTQLPDLAFRPVTCIQCPTMPCAAACSLDAISRNESTGAVVIDPDLCNRCGDCVEACTLGRLHMVDEHMIKCDLCGGSPLCVAWCPRDALTLVEYGTGIEREKPVRR